MKAKKKKTKKRPKTAKKRSKKMSNVTTTSKDSKQLANPGDFSDFGFSNLTQEDIMVPRLLAMQGMSEFVTEGKAKFGEIVDSLSEKVVGGLDSPVEFIPVKLEKSWRVEKKEGNKWLVKRVEPVTPQNEGRGFNGKDDDGEEVRFVRTLNFFVILPSDILDGSDLPYHLTFKSTSLRGGKKVITQIMRQMKMGKSPASAVFKLIPKKVSNDDGTFIVLETEVSRESKKPEVEAANNWAKTLSQGVKVHEEVPF